MFRSAFSTSEYSPSLSVSFHGFSIFCYRIDFVIINVISYFAAFCTTKYIHLDHFMFFIIFDYWIYFVIINVISLFCSVFYYQICPRWSFHVFHHFWLLNIFRHYQRQAAFLLLPNIFRHYHVMSCFSRFAADCSHDQNQFFMLTLCYHLVIVSAMLILFLVSWYRWPCRKNLILQVFFFKRM